MLLCQCSQFSRLCLLHIHLILDCFLCSDDVKPQDVSSGGTVQVDSIHIDNLDVDSKNNEGYALCGNSSVVSSCVHVTLLRPSTVFSQ